MTMCLTLWKCHLNLKDLSQYKGYIAHTFMTHYFILEGFKVNDRYDLISSGLWSGAMNSQINPFRQTNN